MNDSTPHDSPPLLPKTGSATPWCEESLFYLVTGDGLFVCRNHEFFESCAPARRWPSELAGQEPFLVPRFPRIPQALFERIVGFFTQVAEEHEAEAAVLLVWDRRQREVRLIVPPQVASVRLGWSGYRTPIDLRYEMPLDLEADLVPFGDVHSHVFFSAYSSQKDVADERFQAGVHIVVGRLDRDPPDLHVQAVADGTRFDLELGDVVEGYEAPDRAIPEEWMERLEVVEEQWQPVHYRSGHWQSGQRYPSQGTTSSWESSR